MSSLLQTIVAFSGFYFSRYTPFQEGLKEIRTGWTTPSTLFGSVESPYESYEIYNATFGKVLLRILDYSVEHDKENEFLISITLTPAEHFPIEEVTELLTHDLKKRGVKLNSANLVSNDKENYVIRLTNESRNLELVVDKAKLLMITLSEDLAGLYLYDEGKDY